MIGTLFGSTRTRTPAVASTTTSSSMGRYAEPDEIAEMIAFLCSDASRYSTGSSFMLDGGYACR
jgi:NAD(P)-dependent dehydrogenase (short-subunit alcohol dehydrogenase family)